MAETQDRTVEELRQQLEELNTKFQKFSTVGQEEFNRKIDAAIDRMKEQWGSTKSTLKQAAIETKENMVASGQRADQYAHDNPWQVAAIAGTAGLALGIILGLGRNRD